MNTFNKFMGSFSISSLFVASFFFTLTANAKDDGLNEGVEDVIVVSTSPNTNCGGLPPETGDYDDCCQDHGDHDHISGLVLRYVGQTSPATIAFSTEGYSNTSYTATHSLNDVFLIEADDRFGANSHMSINGAEFEVHTSCSDPTNVGYGISTEGTFIPNPNENDSDIVFIIEGLATPNDGWCGADNSSSSCNGTAMFDIENSYSGSLSDFSFFWEDGSTASQRVDLCAGTYSVTVSRVSLDDSSVFVFTIVDAPATIEIEASTVTNTVCDEQTGENNCNCNGYIQEFFFEYTGIPGIGGGAYDEEHDNEYGYWPSLQNNIVYSFIVDSPNHPGQYHQHNDPEFWTNEGEPVGWESFGVVDHSCALDVVGLSFGPFNIVAYTDINGNECHPFLTNCDGVADITASNGEAPYTYLWSDGSTTEDRDDLCAGTYQVTVTDYNGCSNTLDFVEIEGPCDCEGNVLDECGVCGGDGIPAGYDDGCACEDPESSGEVYVLEGVLYIFGTNAADVIQVSDDHPNLKLQNEFNGQSQNDIYIPKASINSIVVVVCGGDDQVQMGSITFPTLIEGGSGADQLQGADGGNDSIYGGSGDDQIQGNGGNDVLIGGSGDDQLQGGNGADSLTQNGDNNSGDVDCGGNDDGECDCDGNVLDECGVCGGDNTTCLDCCGVINGDGTTCDGDCGPCGEGFLDDDCDCNGNQLDECGVCGGDNTTCLDCCGVINGDGTTCDGACGACNDDTSCEDDCPDGWSYCGEGTTWDPVSKNCVCVTSCYGDLFPDGLIQLKDLLELLGVYGTFCD